MKLLVATPTYPTNDGVVGHMFVHVRNKFYKEQGIEVEVLNFKAKTGYYFEGIKVISLKEYTDSSEKYDILLCHAANLKNHYVFLKRYQKRFPRLLFFFHGHEVLRINKEYPQPYSFHKRKVLQNKLQNLYDSFKLMLWSKYYVKLNDKSDFIFVSNWIKNKFFENTKISPKALSRVHVINNSVGEIFRKERYDLEAEKKYDFIFIRDNIDGSKYGVDIINRLAKENKENSFLVIGNGEYFKHYEKSPNIELINHSMSHKEMISYINQARCAILPTREDTQGVTTCEMLVYGIPVITSDIDVCEEFFRDKKNCELISNDARIELSVILNKLEANYSSQRETSFDPDRTMSKEIDVIMRRGRG